MAKYKVLYPFADLLDDSHIYRVGDEFPRRGVIVKPERYKELMGTGNKIGKPLIKEIETPVEKPQTARKASAKANGEDSIAENEKPVKKASTTRKSRK